MPAAEKAVGQAQDLPAAEAQAFLEAMELEKDIQRALALPSNGRRAAAPSDPMQLAAARRQWLLAFLKLLRVDHRCPLPPPCRAATVRHLMAYVSLLWDGDEAGDELAEEPASKPASSGGKTGKAGKGGKGARQRPPPAVRPEVADARHRPLARLVQLYVCAPALPGAQAVAAARDAADILADPVAGPRAAAELAELEALAQLGSAPPPAAALLSFEQLRHAAHCLVVQTALAQLARSAAGGAGARGDLPLTAREQADALAAAAASAQELLTLEPANPKGWALAAAAGAAPGAGVPPHAVLQRCLRGAELAREQRRDYYLAKCGDLALRCALGAAGGLPAEALAQALAAGEAGEAALARCRAALPESWTRPIEAGMQASKATLQGRQAAAAAGGASGAGTSSGQLALEAPPAARCDGCKQPAAKLLRCARCKAAVYCSKACQIKAWPAHKSDGSCQPQGKEN